MANKTASKAKHRSFVPSSPINPLLLTILVGIIVFFIGYIVYIIGSVDSASITDTSDTTTFSIPRVRVHPTVKPVKSAIPTISLRH